MFRPIGLRTSNRAAVAAVAGLLTLPWLIASGGTASAAGGTKIKATYPVTGSTFIKAPDFTLPLGPGTLSSTVNVNTGKLTADLKLPDATGSFKQEGLIPVTATTRFINDGPTTGKISGSGVVHSTSRITLRIVDLKVAGVDVPVGDSCETSAPVVVKVASQPGFNIIKGGNLAGTYTIPQFANCKLATVLINLSIPGSGNTLTLKLGKPRFGG